MVFLTECRICSSKKYDVLLEQSFQRPGAGTGNINGSQDSIIGENYVKIRLDILFNAILNDNKLNFYDISIRKCKDCGFVYFTPCPDEADLIKKYSELEKKYSEIDRLTLAEKVSAKVMELRQNRVYDLLASSIPDFKKTQRILDYGGYRGDNLKKFFNTHRCFVVDYVVDEYYKEIEYIKGDVSAIGNGIGFDIILLQHTLEHIFDPVGYLQKLSGLLNSHGVIYIEVPLGCFREYKSLAEPLTHINFFSEESLVECVNQANLKTIYLSTDYQTVYNLSKTWCINLIAQKNNNHAVKIIPQKTDYQMQNWKYKVVYFTDIRKFPKRLRNLFNKTFKLL
ncbi:MAG: class I SAM-dependent methyltransferase [Desulfobacteraceae bacterium]